MTSFDSSSVDAFQLWFHLLNPLSTSFWTHFGFEPIVTRYVRRPLA